MDKGIYNKYKIQNKMGIIDKLRARFGEQARYAKEIKENPDPEYRKELYQQRERMKVQQAKYKAQQFYNSSGNVNYPKGRVNPRLVQAINSVAGVRSSGNGRVGPNYGRRGRPKGAYDGRYAAYGGVYGYRKYMSQQRRMALLKAQAEMQNMQQPGQAQPLPPQIPNQYPQARPMPQQMQQPQPQVTQNKPGISLWDNTFMKMDQIQPSQNKNVMDSALNPELPAGDPNGDYYTEPDFFSGKQVLRRRSGDKLFKW